MLLLYSNIAFYITLPLLIGPAKTLIEHDDEKEALIRQAIRQAHKLQMIYTDFHGESSQRVIWPLAVGFFEEVHVVIAWCELRSDFRHFRTDRIDKLMQVKTRYPKRRQTLLKKWREFYNISEQ